MGHSRPLFFFIFVFSIQLTVKIVQYQFCRWLDSNRGPLMLQATALPTEPQPLPGRKFLDSNLATILSEKTFIVRMRDFKQRKVKSNCLSFTICKKQCAWQSESALTRSVQLASLPLASLPGRSKLHILRTIQFSHLRRMRDCVT